MIQLKTAIYACLGLMVYYAIFQVFSDIMRAGMKTNTKNRLITQLRSDYEVNIRTFQKNIALLGFAWFKSIWLNENLFRNKKLLLFTFHHEYYHLTHNHKLYTLGMRLLYSLIPLLLIFIHWAIFIPIALVLAYMINHIQDGFEDKANGYAKTMLENDNAQKKGEGGNK